MWVENKEDLVRNLQFLNKAALEEFVAAHVLGETLRYNQYISATKATEHNEKADVRLHILSSTSGKDISRFNQAEEEVIYKTEVAHFEVRRIERSEDRIDILLREVERK